MKRRHFITLLGGAAAAWPLTARAQQPKMPMVDFLNSASLEPNRKLVEAFVQSLSQNGYIERKNLAIEYRWANGQYDRLPALAAELVQRQVAVIAAAAPVAALAAQKATTSIPIVFGLGSDPVKDGLGILWDAISVDQFSAAERRAKIFGLQVHSLKLENPPYAFEAAFRALAAASTETLLVLSSPHFQPARARIAQLAILQRLPTMFIFKTYVEADGTLSYGADFVAMHRQAATHVAKILKGAKVGDIPIEQPNQFEFSVNLRTAKAIGIELPTSILLRADEVIE